MSEPTTMRTASQTTTSHRPGCQRPGWEVTVARSVAGVRIARCSGCGAVELRTEANR